MRQVGEAKVQSDDQQQRLIDINTTDILNAFGLTPVGWRRKLLAALCYYPARRFTKQVIYYDQLVKTEGLQNASIGMLSQLHNRLTVSGEKQIPSSGPVLFVANHPGLADTTALFATIPRADLRTLAADRPFLRALPRIAQTLIFLDEEATNNLNAVRLATRHLRSGGAILTFPAGQIEPDPAILPGAVAALQQWSDSTILFARLAPETQIVPVVVTGVLSPHAQRNPIRLLRRTQKDREWLGATLQLLIPAYQRVNVHIAFGEPIAVNHLLKLSHRNAAMQFIIDAMRQLIEQHQ